MAEAELQQLNPKEIEKLIDQRVSELKFCRVVEAKEAKKPGLCQRLWERIWKIRQ